MSATNGHSSNGQQRTSPFPDGWNEGPALAAQQPLFNERQGDAILNAMLARQAWFNQLFDPRRNLEDECGYPPMDSTPSIDLFRQLYDREPIPNRIVQCMPKESWQASPLVYEDDSSKTSTAFEEGWDNLGQQLTPGGGASWHQDEEGSPVWEHLLRGDILSRVGRFGLVLLGVDDGKGLETPLAGVVAVPLANRKVTPILAPDPTQPGKQKQVGVKLGRMVRNERITPVPDYPMTQELEDALLDGRAFKRANVWNSKGKRYETVDGIPLNEQERAVVANWVHERQVAINRQLGLSDSQATINAVPLSDALPLPPTMAELDGVVNASKWDGQRGEDWSGRKDDGPRQAGAALDSPNRPDSTSSVDPAVRFSSSAPDSDPAARAERILDERTFDSAKDSNGKSPFTDWSKPEEGSSALAGTDSQYYGVHFGPSQFPAGRGPSVPPSPGGRDGSAPSSPTDGVPDAAAPESGNTGPSQPNYANVGPSPAGSSPPNAAGGGQGAGDSSPPASKPRQRLLFLACYDESLVQVVRWEWNIRNPRFRMPVMYRVTLTDPRDGATGVGLPYATVFVHWSRVVHLADVHANASSSDTFAQPVVKPVLNRCLDVRKVSGAGAEAYWRSCFNILSFETHPQLGGEVLIDKAALRDENEKAQNSLERTLITSGMEVKPIAPSVVDPTPHLAALVEHICIQIGIPKRVFMGSERGELASSQDDASWNDRVNQRRHGYCTPRIIVPFIDRLIQAGVLPEPEGYSVEWPDLDSTSDSDKATIGGTRTTALAAYVAGGCDSLVSPIDFLVEYQGMDEERAAAVLRNTARINEEKEQAAAAQQGGPLGPDGQPMPAFGIPGDATQATDENGQPIDPNAQPEQPPPEKPPVVPIKMREGERLVHPETGEDIKQPSAEESPFGIAVNAANFQERVWAACQKLNRHLGRMPGYGQVYVRSGPEVWYVGGDGDEREFGKLVEPAFKRCGAKSVRYEAEAFPKEGDGWKEVTGPDDVQNELVANAASAALAQWDAWFGAVQGPELEAWRLVRNDGMPAEAKLRFAERLELARLDKAQQEQAPPDRVANGFCPTGEGGGVDDSCPASDVSTGVQDGEDAETASLVKTAKKLYPKVGEEVDGRKVIRKVDNQDSIEASLGSYRIVQGLREVLMKEGQDLASSYYSADDKRRVDSLAAKIRASGKISGLIVVDDGDKEGWWVLEGGHRFDALKQLGAKSFPAMVVLDLDGIEERRKNGTLRADLGGKPVLNAAPSLPSFQEIALRVAQHGLPAGTPFTPDKAEAEHWVANQEGWVIAELELPAVLLRNDMYTLNAAVDPRWVSSLLVNEEGTVRVYAPLRNDSPPQWDEAKHSRDKGKFSSTGGTGAAPKPAPAAKPPMGTAPSPGMGVDAHGQVGAPHVPAAAGGEAHGEPHVPGDEHGGGHHAHGPEGEVEHAAHQAHLLHEGHEIAEVLGGGHEHAAEALHSHFEEAAGHAPDAHHVGHSPLDAGAIVASHLLGPALKAVSAVLAKVPGARRVGAAISALHEGASKLADKAVANLQERYGKATAGAILGAGSLSIGSVHALAGIPGTVTKSLPAKNLIGAIPLLAVAEAGKRLGLVGPGTKLEAGLTRAGSWIHAIKSAVGSGASAASSAVGKAGLAGAKLAGRGVGKLIGNEEDGYIVVNRLGQWIDHPGWVNVGPDAFVLVGLDGRVVLDRDKPGKVVTE